MAAGSPAPFPTIDKCPSENRKTHVVVSDLDGTLFRGRSSFPYFALVAYESGGVLRLLLLLLLTPLAGLLHHFGSESAGIQVLIFASLAGVRLASIDSIARAVLPKFYAADLHPDTWRVFSACGRRCVLTENPRVMVEPFLKEFLGADEVVGTELCSYKGWATGLVRRPGVLVGKKKAAALVKVFGLESPEIGIGDRKTDFPFLSLCKEGYVVEPRRGVEAVRREELPKPVIFHDGRLVEKPTPFFALCTVLWIPIGFVLSCVRVAAISLLPMRHVRLALSILGVHFVVRGTPLPPSDGSSRVLFICNHRAVLDPVFLSVVLGRPVAGATYSVSRLSEFLSPIKAARLTRHRAEDAAIMGGLLREGDLAICPEGTTCREPFLLRFSALFAELTDEIVPVALVNTMSMFHGTTARGWKGMDPFYFLMNPRPSYEVIFLRNLPMEMTCGAGGRKSHEVANYVQREIAAQLGYQCTQLTRKDKYMALAGNDGSVAVKPADLRHRNVG